MTGSLLCNAATVYPRHRVGAGRLPVAIVGFLLAFSLHGNDQAGPPGAGDRDSDKHSELVRGWIADLGSENAAVRETAARQLRATPTSALQVLVDVARREPNRRPAVLDLLSEFTFSTNDGAAAVALGALREMAAAADAGLRASARAVVAARLQRQTNELRRLGATVFTRGDDIVEVLLNGCSLADADLRWLRDSSHLTDLSMERTAITDAGLRYLRNLPRLEWLNLYRTRVGDEGLRQLESNSGIRQLPLGETLVTDNGLAHLKSLQHLEYLGLRGNPITDDGLVHLKDLTQLTGLHLGETRITDAGLRHLLGLADLRRLWLNATRVTDAGIETLENFRRLEELFLTGTKITEGGVARLTRSLPQCRIER